MRTHYAMHIDGYRIFEGNLMSPYKLLKLRRGSDEQTGSAYVLVMLASVAEHHVTHGQSKAG